MTPMPTPKVRQVPQAGAAGPDRVAGPALALIVLGITGLLLLLVPMILSMIQRSWVIRAPGALRFILPGLSSGNYVLNAIFLILNAVILWGGVKMFKRKDYVLALTAAVLAVIPGVGPFVILGIPLGVWALVVLRQPQVKAAFH
jgi:hypothetical protein